MNIYTDQNSERIGAVSSEEGIMSEMNHKPQTTLKQIKNKQVQLLQIEN